MKVKSGIILAFLVLLLGGGLVYRFTHLKTGQKSEKSEIKKEEAKAPGEAVEKKEGPQEVKIDRDVQEKYEIKVATAKKDGMCGLITSTGKVEVNADRIAHVSPRVGGKVVSVGVSLGDFVKAGQVLARLDSVELGEAVSRYKQSRAKIALAEGNMERVKKLVEKKIAARKEILQAETELLSAQSELQADKDRLLMYGLSENEINAPESRRALLPVASPISGVVTEKTVIAGELADPSKNVFTVADLSTLWVQVDINEKDLGKVRKGQKADVVVGAFPGKVFKGRITYIADLVDEATRTVKARVEVSNPGRQLKPEMFATVQLTLPVCGPAVLAVPDEAIQDMEGKKVVFVTENGVEFKPAEVQIGNKSGGMVEIISGIEEGEKYVAKGGFLVKSELQKGVLGEE